MLFESLFYFSFISFLLSLPLFSFIYLFIFSSYYVLLSPHLPTLPETHAPLLSIFLFFLISLGFPPLFVSLPHLSWPTAPIISMPTTPPQHHYHPIPQHKISKMVISFPSISTLIFLGLGLNFAYLGLCLVCLFHLGVGDLGLLAFVLFGFINFWILMLDRSN